MTDTDQQAAAASNNQQQFSIHKVYVKDVSFEAPNTPEIFTQEWKPDVQVQLHTEHKKLSDEMFDVTLQVTVTAKLGDKTAYLVEIKQAGIFVARNMPAENMGHLLGSFCPNILFPYVREAISAQIGKGGFPELFLAPVNFDALYQQHLQQKQAQAAQTSEAATTH